jgi:hypothetical protein
MRRWFLTLGRCARALRAVAKVSLWVWGTSGRNLKRTFFVSFFLVFSNTRWVLKFGVGVVAYLCGLLSWWWVVAFRFGCCESFEGVVGLFAAWIGLGWDEIAERIVGGLGGRGSTCVDDR